MESRRNSQVELQRTILSESHQTIVWFLFPTNQQFKNIQCCDTIKIMERQSITAIALSLIPIPAYFLYFTLLNCSNNIAISALSKTQSIVISIDSFLGSDLVAILFFFILPIVGLIKCFNLLRKREVTSKLTRVGLVISITFVILYLILGWLVTSSMTTARMKGLEASIKAHLHNARGVAVEYFETNKNYGISTSGCNNGMFQEALSENINAVIEISSSTVVCNSDGLSYSISTALKTEKVGLLCPATLTRNYCIDSTGFAGIVEKIPTGTKCLNQ